MLAIAYTCGAASVGTASLIPAVLTPLPMVAYTLQVADTLTLIPAVVHRSVSVADTLQVADTLTLIPAVLLLLKICRFSVR